MSLPNGRIVLIETHYAGNLGSVARLMRNFGLTDLVLVAPRADRADPQARQMSTHGEAILNQARIVAALDEAIHDCVLVVGTAAPSGGRFRQQNVGTPRAIMPHVADALAQGRVALVFGPEPTGLTDAVVTRCQYLIRIPTAEDYPSLNLAQAVAICLYELSITSLPPSTRADGLATNEAKGLMFRHLQTALEEIHFLFGDRADSLMHAVRHLLGKARLTETEVNILHGLARQIRWHVAHHPRAEPAGPLTTDYTDLTD